MRLGFVSMTDGSSSEAASLWEVVVSWDAEGEHWVFEFREAVARWE